jgi:Brp/Blh family beta-carotene 15,15'-monooxygenase
MVGTMLVLGGRVDGAPAVTANLVLVVAGLGLVAGIPHGAADHIMATRLLGGRSMVLVAAAYFCVALTAWVLLEWAGPIARSVVMALSALHCGLGELEVSHQLTGWQPRRGLALAIVIGGSGALVLPLARSGEQLREVATAVSPDLARLIGEAPVQIGLVVIWLVAALVAVTASLWSGHPAVALDIALIGALGMLAPPLVAFAVWFGGWHGLRHCARMLTIEPGCAALVSTGQRRASALRLIQLAALPSMAALTTVAALGWFTVAAPDPTVVVAEVLRLLLALTVPHMVVVLWIDRATEREDRDTVRGARDLPVTRLLRRAVTNPSPRWNATSRDGVW